MSNQNRGSGIPLAQGARPLPTTSRATRATAAAQADDTSEKRFIAQKLIEVADLLQQQNANGFRVNACRDAASYILRMGPHLRDIVIKDGRKDLEGLPNIGTSIARAI